MRWSWIVLLGVIGAGVYAFVRADGDETTSAAPTREDDREAVAEDLSLSTEEKRRESEAIRLVNAMALPAGASTPTDDDAVWSRLLGEYGDTLAARRAAYRKGVEVYGAVPSRRESHERRIVELDRARRLLSRGVYLPEMFQPGGADTEERTRLLSVLTDANREVMTWPRGVDGVTRVYRVEPGLAPVQIVHRQQVPAGVNAILWWNQGGNLDPRRLRGGQDLLLPLEAVRIQVVQDVHRLSIWIGDWFVKEFRVGVGREETPTPTGSFVVVDKQENPRWTTRQNGRLVEIPAGDPRNELGAVWMAIESPEWPRSAGYGIHGTVRPDTVGTHCSNGCVRLANEQAQEVFGWVRREGNGVPGTTVTIRYR